MRTGLASEASRTEAATQCAQGLIFSQRCFLPHRPLFPLPHPSAAHAPHHCNYSLITHMELTHTHSYTHLCAYTHTLTCVYVMAQRNTLTQCTQSHIQSLGGEPGFEASSEWKLRIFCVRGEECSLSLLSASLSLQTSHSVLFVLSAKIIF